MSFLSKNDNQIDNSIILSETIDLNPSKIDDNFEKTPSSILKTPKNNLKNDLMISSKKQLIGDILNDNTLDGFSIEENTMMTTTNDIATDIGVTEDIDDDLSQISQTGCSQNIVTFNLKDTQQEMSENKPESRVKRGKRRGSAFIVDQSIAYE
jgi:hypothetical protein